MTFWNPISLRHKQSPKFHQHIFVIPSRGYLLTSRRIERFNAVLRAEISRILAEDLKDPRLASMVSITQVSTSADMGKSRVFVSVLGHYDDKINTLKAIRSASGYIRRTIVAQLSQKRVPVLEFHIDDSIERGSEMLKLIETMAVPEINEGK